MQTHAVVVGLEVNLLQTAETYTQCQSWWLARARALAIELR